MQEEYLCTQPHIQCLISQLSSSQNERERDVNLTYPPFKLAKRASKTTGPWRIALSTFRTIGP